MKRNNGLAEMLLGVLLILGALGLAMYNGWQERSAGEESLFIMQQLEAAQKEPDAPMDAQEEEILREEEDAVTETARPAPVQPEYEAAQAGELIMTPTPEQAKPVQSAASSEQIPAGEPTPEPVLVPAEENLPDFLRYPEIEMPVVEIGGRLYIGTLEIPALELSLPVMSEWSYPGLKKAPCRYYGSAYTHDLVISAHNYATHFGRLRKLSQGDAVRFTDTQGNVFEYAVASFETLQPTQVEEMRQSGYDLTLFTCTIGGAARVTMRCTLENVVPAQEEAQENLN